MRILLVEDDLDMSTALSRALSRRGFHVTLCLDGNTALRQMREGSNDAVVLDLAIPGLDGLHLLHRTRSQGILTPVLILTGRNSVGDRIAGLNAGADDYLSKPFDLGELEARLRALGRRQAAPVRRIECGALRLDLDSGAIFAADMPMALGPREACVLRALLAQPGHAVAKEALYRLAYPEQAPERQDFVEVLVHRLRRKVSGCGVEILTLRGLGYLLRRERGG
ncbi:Tricarboxylate transport transcriptional regulator TctD [plant metagenome]|uniref:Tricarboxylate transport transcriptional regulator TctD n=1 Tax=plant metagenome TaxID=1297885 RepID=A0A484P0C4_9ZZZZ